VTNIF
jgi:hypothetical protein